MISGQYLSTPKNCPLIIEPSESLKILMFLGALWSVVNFLEKEKISNVKAIIKKIYWNKKGEQWYKTIGQKNYVISLHFIKWNCDTDNIFIFRRFSHFTADGEEETRREQGEVYPPPQGLAL